MTTEKRNLMIVDLLRRIEQRGRHLSQPDCFNGHNPKTYTVSSGSRIKSETRQLAKLLGVTVKWSKPRRVKK